MFKKESCYFQNVVCLFWTFQIAGHVLVKKSPSPAISKMWSAFFEHSKLPEIFMLSCLVNFQLIPVYSDCIVDTVRARKLWNRKPTVRYSSDMWNEHETQKLRIVNRPISSNKWHNRLLVKPFALEQHQIHFNVVFFIHSFLVLTL